MVQAQASSAEISKMLEDCKNFDPDVRQTGASDLLNAFLRREDSFEEAVERRIIEIWVTQLKDKNMEVKSNSVRCIKATSDRMREQNIMKVTDSLAGEIASGNASDALDIYSLTL